jgi:hypothetical protein
MVEVVVGGGEWRRDHGWRTCVHCGVNGGVKVVKWTCTCACVNAGVNVCVNVCVNGGVAGGGEDAGLRTSTTVP